MRKLILIILTTLTPVTGIVTYKNIEEEKIKESTIIDIPDENLKKSINDELGRGEVLGDINQSDMESLTVLEAQEKGIKNLTGLEYATNLIDLNLNNNEISDISRLKNLTKLVHLNLIQNQISDISGLKDLTELSNLYLSNNEISDISRLKKWIS